MANFNKIPAGYKNEASLPKRSGIYMGLVRRNVDPQRMGRLLVWISDFGPDTIEFWLPVSYSSPFAGTTPIADTKKGGESEDDSQKSYGFWATPPDIDNQVLCCFLDGDIANGFWIGCVYPQNMNQMVPGIGSSKPSTDPQQDEKFPLYGPPTVEYNKYDVNNAPAATNNSPTANNFDREKVKRPVFTPLANGLKAQGLQDDPERGTSNSSARRESPSRVFGMLSPRGNSIHIDDGPQGGDTENEFIRFRTRSGAQILIHETSGYIYMITKGGRSWIEISDSGIDMFSQGSISMASDEDVNIYAGGKVGIHGTKGIQMAAESLTSFTSGNTNLVADGNLYMDSSHDIGIKSSQDVNLDAVRDVSENAGRNVVQGACGYASRNAKKILDNSEGAAPADVPHAEYERNVNSRVPTHEPFDHGISYNSPAGQSSVTTISSDGTTQTVVQSPTAIAANKKEIQKHIYDKLISLGWTPEGARTMVAQIGRENDYQARYMFGTHTDGGANSKTNVGIISWQDGAIDRRTALIRYLNSKGLIDAKGQVVPGYATLDAQLEYMNNEMKTRYKGAYSAVRDTNKTYSGGLEDYLSRHYIGWAKDGSSNGRFTKSDANRALSKMNNYYANIKKSTS